MPRNRQSGGQGDIASLRYRVRLVRCLSEKKDSSSILTTPLVLGNIKRMLDISKYLVATHANVSVLDRLRLHRWCMAFRIPARIDYIKLPCLSRTLSGSYDVKYLELGYENTVGYAPICLRTRCWTFPDLILVDKKPLGVSNELSAGLELLQRRAAFPSWYFCSAISSTVRKRPQRCGRSTVTTRLCKIFTTRILVCRLAGNLQSAY